MRSMTDTSGIVPTIARLDIAGVTADSRHVVPGDLFAALPGARVDGRSFIADAVKRGAVAVLAPPGTLWPEGVPQRPIIFDPEPRRCLARIAAVLAGPQPATARPAPWSSPASFGLRLERRQRASVRLA
jgi:UDP-N-acetylmuramoyl-L-alanyl-D-glutamate--2,6-diaminopimelate ligase